MQNLSKAQLSTWKDFENDLSNLNVSIQRLKLKYTLWLDSAQFAQKRGITINKRSNLFDNITKLSNQVLKINIAYSYTQTYNAGANPSKRYPGDLDIVSFADNLTPSQISAGQLPADLTDQNMGIAPIIVGAIALTVLIVGAVTTVAVLQNREKAYELEITKGQQAVDRALLSKPDLIPAWTKYKQTVQAQNRSLIDSLFGLGTGRQFAGGIMGIAVLLVGGYLLMKHMDNK